MVEFIPFKIRLINYDAIIYIYEQQGKIPLPDDDFDMEQFTEEYKLNLLYVIEFTILQQLEKKPNIYSTRVFNQKLKTCKNI